MGLFKKKPKAETPDPLREELAALEIRLGDAERARTALETQVAELATANAALTTQISMLDQTTGDTDERLDTLDGRLTAVDELEVRVRELAERLDTPIASTPAPPPPVTPPPPTTGSVEPPPPPPALGEDDEWVEDLTARLDDVSEKLHAMDGRVTAVSTELANQLTELSRDIDELNRRAQTTGATADGGAVDTTELEARLADRLDAAIDDVLDTTERLAAEQARYEIQFRADLAELAERIRRPGAA